MPNLTTWCPSSATSTRQRRSKRMSNCLEPHLGQETRLCSQPSTWHTFQRFIAISLPATAAEPMIVWAEYRATCVSTNTYPATFRGSPLSARLFYGAVDFSGRDLLKLRAYTILVHPTPHRMLARTWTGAPPPGCGAFPFSWRFNVAHMAKVLLLIKEDYTKGIEPHDEVGPLLHRLTHTLGMGIASICHGDMPARRCLSVSPVCTSLTSTSINCKVIRSIAIWRRWLVPVAPGA